MVQEEVPASAAHDVGEGPGWPGSPLLPGSPCGDEWLSGLQPLAPPALDLPLPCDGEAAFPLDVIGPPAGVAPASCSLAPGAPIDALPQGGALAGPQQDASMLGYPQLPACAGPLHLQLLGRLPSAPVAVCAAEPGGRDGATMAARCESLPRTRSGGAWQGRSKPLEEYKRDPEIHRWLRGMQGGGWGWGLARQAAVVCSLQQRACGVQPRVLHLSGAWERAK